MSWLADFVNGDVSDDALAAMLDGGFDIDLSSTDPALWTPYPSSPSDSVNSSSRSTTDCTDTASDHGTEWSSASSSGLASPRLKTPLDKEAARVATNHARLYRYYRSQGELVGLRRKVAELQSLLEKLKKEDARPCSASLQTAPCPFVDDAGDEINLDGDATLKKTSRSLSMRSSGTWKEAAMEEHRRLQRAQAARRKLKRLLRSYENSNENFIRQLSSGQVETGHDDSTPIPSLVPPLLPGAETMEAFTISGIIILRELYHIACSTCGISPAASVPLGKSGGKLAYSFLLGANFESGWSREYTFPQGDPRNIAAMWLRGARTQGPRKEIFRTSMKTHELEHVCFERKFTWRLDALQRATTVDLDGVTMMQMVEADDHVIVVWAVSFHANTMDAPPPPFFRASGWMIFRVSPDGTVSCRTCARVHNALLHSTDRESVERQSVVNAWTELQQAKQRRMWNRLLLVV